MHLANFYNILLMATVIFFEYSPTIAGLTLASPLYTDSDDGSSVVNPAAENSNDADTPNTIQELESSEENKEPEFKLSNLLRGLITAPAFHRKIRMIDGQDERKRMRPGGTILLGKRFQMRLRAPIILRKKPTEEEGYNTKK